MLTFDGLNRDGEQILSHTRGRREVKRRSELASKGRFNVVHVAVHVIITNVYSRKGKKASKSR